VSRGKTVFILGAGASFEARLPTGDQLRDKIASLLDMSFEFGDQKKGDLIIADAIRIQAKRTNDPKRGSTYVQAAQRIKSGMQYAISIDNYLHQHRNDKEAEFCGKLAIVRAILDAEHGSLMYMEPHDPAHKFPQSALAPTWFASLWQVLTDGCSVDDLKARFESIAFVIFNYDRCIEHYLYHALQVFYRLSAGDAKTLLRSLEIRHPYGTVGALPWQADGVPTIGFGDEPSAPELLALSSLIKTFTESIDPTHSDIVSIRTTVRSAQKLVVLGFGFYDQNMKLLWPDKVESRSNGGSCYATAYRISDADVHIIKGDLEDLTGMPGANLHVRNGLKCFELFSEFRRGLRIT
jgi:hypothetical protein